MLEFRCQNNTIAQKVCIEAGCSVHAFACERRNCCPHQSHAGCKTLKFENFVESLETSFERLLRISESVSKFYQDLIKQATKDALIFSEWVQKQLQVKENLMEKVREGKTIHGSEVTQIMEQSSKYSQQFEEHIVAFTIHWEKILKNQLNSIREELYEHDPKSDKERNSGRNSNSLYHVPISTNMKWREEEQDMLLELISEEKRIKELKKLYTASNENFSIKKFHQLCDKKTNTLVLVQNSKGRIYGGFTPCSWESNLTGEYKVDHQHRSFVFNVNNGTKYPLVEEKYAIQCHVLFGPIFGRGGLLMIQDQADLNPTYWETLPLTYLPASGQNWTKELYTEFVGAEQGEKFTISEWEVFEVFFQ